MQTLANTDYYPSGTWDEFRHNLPWRPDTYADSAYKAFKEAIRRGISRSDVFFDVAEAIHRSYCAYNWGVLNWNWKLALQDSHHDHQSKIPVPTPKPPPPPSFQRSMPTVDGKGVAAHQYRHNGTAPHNGNWHRSWNNGAKYQQRRPASLASYYE
jgi:hypothetical protein